MVPGSIEAGENAVECYSLSQKMAVVFNTMSGFAMS